jgi:ribosomal protein S3
MAAALLAAAGRVAAATRRRLIGYGVALACVGLGSLGVPVFVTTAAGLETQAIVLGYLLATGFVAQEIVGLARERCSR